MPQVHASNVTFMARTTAPICPAEVVMHLEDYDLDMVWQCALVAGHRQKKHRFTIRTTDDQELEMFWSNTH